MIILSRKYVFVSFRASINKSCKNIVISTCTVSTPNTMPYLKQMRKEIVLQLSSRFKIPYLPLSLLLNGYKALASFIDNQLMPLIFLRTTPYLSVSIYNNIDNKLKKKLFDKFLVYDKHELNLMHRFLGIVSLLMK